MNILSRAFPPKKAKSLMSSTGSDCFQTPWVLTKRPPSNNFSIRPPQWVFSIRPQKELQKAYLDPPKDVVLLVSCTKKPLRTPTTRPFGWCWYPNGVWTSLEIRPANLHEREEEKLEVKVVAEGADGLSDTWSERRAFGMFWGRREG